MPPKKTADSAEPAEPPRRSSRVASRPPTIEKEAAPAAVKKPTSTKAKKPASKAAEKPESTKAAKAPASKKRPAEEAPAKAPASKKAKEDDSAKPKSTKKPASTKAAASEKPASKAATEKKPASKAAAAAAAAAEKPASKAAKPASKKPASKAAADKPKPKSKKAVETIAEEDTEGKTQDEKMEIEAAAEGSEPETASALKEGETLPKITLKDNKNEDVDVSTLVTDDHGLIFFTYPKADTPGCTSQACLFRDSFPDFEKVGYKVYGLSTDLPEAQEKWSQKKEFGYPLLSDPQSELIKKLGAFAHPKNTVRSHFIFEKGTGKLLEAKLKVKPADDAKNCLEFIKKHHA